MKFGSAADWEDGFSGPELLPHWVGGHLNGSAELRLTVSN